MFIDFDPSDDIKMKNRFLHLLLSINLNSNSSDDENSNNSSTSYDYEDVFLNKSLKIPLNQYNIEFFSFCCSFINEEKRKKPSKQRK